MKPRVTVLTVGVDDLEKALRFYRDGLGLPTQGIVGREFEHGAVAFFDLHSGLKLAVWPRNDIAYDARIPKGAKSATEFTIGHNVNSKEEVDAVMGAGKKGGRDYHQGRARHVLGRVRPLLSRPRWSLVGGCVESPDEDQKGFS